MNDLEFRKTLEKLDKISSEKNTNRQKLTESPADVAYVSKMKNIFTEMENDAKNEKLKEARGENFVAAILKKEGYPVLYVDKTGPSGNLSYKVAMNVSKEVAEKTKNDLEAICDKYKELEFAEVSIVRYAFHGQTTDWRTAIRAEQGVFDDNRSTKTSYSVRLIVPNDEVLVDSINEEATVETDDHMEKEMKILNSLEDHLSEIETTLKKLVDTDENCHEVMDKVKELADFLKG